jgi:Flp pilus assembly protein TadD
MDLSLHRTERTYSRLILVLFVAFISFIVLCWVGYRVYTRWQERHYLHQAHLAQEKNDLRWAALAARRAFAWRPDSVDACRVLADVAERQNAEEAIDWRQRAVELAPDSLPDLVWLAEAALRFGRQPLATETLERVPERERASPVYQSAAAQLAVARKDLDAALQHLTEAARLAPNDASRQLALAKFELRSADRARVEHGRALALETKQKPQAQAAALSILLEHAVRAREKGAAISFAKEIMALRDAPFALRLDALDAMRIFNDPGFASTLGQMQGEAYDSVPQAVALVHWMNGRNLALLAIDWTKRLPSTTSSDLRMMAALADSFVLLRDWTALAALLKQKNWSSAQVLQHVLSAKLARETGDIGSFERNWAAAVEKARSQRRQLELLERLATQWHWDTQVAAVLWLLTDNPETERDSLQSLYRYYWQNGDTAGLYRTLVRMQKAMPGDDAVRNNLAQVSLLLSVESAKACETARKLVARNPGNPTYTSTYGFGLLRIGDTAGALKVMQHLTAEQLRAPPIAAYYGMILASADHKEEARHYLALGEKAMLLPEEKALFTQARQLVAADKNDSQF